MGGDTQTTDKNPWKPAQPGLKDAIGQTTDWFNNQQPLYQGRFTPDNSPLRSEALGWSTDNARQLQQAGFGMPVLNLADQWAAHLAQNGGNVPQFSSYDPTAIQPVVDALTRPVTQDFTQNILPGIYDAADRAGAAHNVRTSIDAANAAETYGRGVSDTAVKAGYQDFSDWRNLQANADLAMTQNLPALYGAGAQMEQLPSQILDAAGQGYENLQQNDITNALSQDQYNRQIPLQALQAYMGLMATAGGQGGTTTTTTQYDPVTQAIQVLAAGAAAAKAASGAGGSMREIKENISTLDSLRELPIYMYNYIGDDRPRVGPMADEWAERFGGDGKVIPMPQIYGVLLAGVKELAQQIKELKAELKELRDARNSHSS